MKISSENVRMILMDCFYDDGEDQANAVMVHGAKLKAGFNPERLERNKANISEMLSQLPDTFKKESGGGWSFLNACENAQGEQWTGFHTSVDELLCLGLAIGKVSFCLPREMWDVFPGGMPYFTVDLSESPNQVLDNSLKF